MPSCNVCMEFYDEAVRRPKVLPCGHSSCLSCLLTMEARQAGPIQCPHAGCRFFCLDCSNKAHPDCLSDGHALCTLAARIRKLEGRLEEAATKLRGEVLAALDESPFWCSVEQMDQELQLLSCQEAIAITCSSWRAESVELQEQPALRAAMLLLLRQRQLHQLEQEEEQKEEQQQPQEEQPPAVLVELDFNTLTFSSPGERTEEKAAVLELPAVHVLRKVRNDGDYAWVLQMLRRHAATLQELELLLVSRELLRELQSMPRLRRLELSWCDRGLMVCPALLGPWRGRLEWLRINDVPKPTLRSLLAAHRHSLQELELRVGTPLPPGKQDRWTNNCSDLPALVKGLYRLTRLTLERDSIAHSGCPAQLAAVRSVLPGCTVQCNKCSG